TVYVGCATGRPGGPSHPARTIVSRGGPVTKRIIIIGGGPAGYEAALVAAQHGADVTVVDAEGIGGNCVLTDCVPSKTFIATTGVRTDMRRAEEMGVQAHFDPTAYRLTHPAQRPGQVAGPGPVRRHPVTAPAGGRPPALRSRPAPRLPARYGRPQCPRLPRDRAGHGPRGGCGAAGNGLDPASAPGRRARRRADPHLAAALRPDRAPHTPRRGGLRR